MRKTGAGHPRARFANPSESEQNVSRQPGETMRIRAGKFLLWTAIAGLCAFAVGTIALRRGESINAMWLIVAALCSYALGYRFYSAFIAAKVLAIDATRATPAERLENGRDFIPTNKWVVFGHHFAAIAGPGPLVGPVLAAQFGYAPGLLWLIAGVVLAGAVHDLIVLWASTRRGGKSLAEIARQEMGSVAGITTGIAVVFIVIIALAGLGLVVVNALSESPWGTFTIGATVALPIGPVAPGPVFLRVNAPVLAIVASLLMATSVATLDEFPTKM